tara:strand:+ start:698 stop:1060 length:363 start_codon:yes stop_codon:yes gene_type:complete
MAEIKKEEKPTKDLTFNELRKLGRSYNIAMSIDLVGVNRNTLMNEIKLLGYEIDANNKQLVGKRGVKDKTRRPRIVKMPSNNQATKDEKENKKELKKEHVIAFILKNKDILKDKRLAHLF